MMAISYRFCFSRSNLVTASSLSRMI